MAKENRECFSPFLGESIPPAGGQQHVQSVPWESWDPNGEIPGRPIVQLYHY